MISSLVGAHRNAPGKRVMLADFGVAGQVEHTEDLRRSLVGTPAFMSPEMLEGRPYNSHLDGCRRPDESFI